MKFSMNENYSRVLRELEVNLAGLAKQISSDCSEMLSRYLQQGEDVFFKLNLKGPMELLVLCATSWFIENPELRVLLQVELYDHYIKKYGPDYEQKVALLLESRAKTLVYIIESSALGKNPNEVFGNIRAYRPRVRIHRFLKKRPKRTLRHRGYRDKGTLRSGDEYLEEEQKDYRLQRLQEQIELQRKFTETSIAFWSGWLD